VLVARHRPARRSGSQSERGSASLEIAILGPALLLMIFAVIQAGLWFYARNLALAAAQEGADAARGYQASADAGVARAESFLQRAARDSLQSATVSSSGSTPTTVRIEVRGRSLSVIPGLPGLPVFQFAQAPVERFTVSQP
jgi:Flp pilus assembly protein TadG